MIYWWLMIVGGLKDGLNPCLLMMAAVLALVWFFVNGKGLAARPVSALFLFNVFWMTFLVNLGLAAGVLALPKVRAGLAIGYCALALVMLVAGLMLLSDWFHMLRSGGQAPWIHKIFSSKTAWKNSRLIQLCLWPAVLFLSAGTSLWPTDYYVTMVGNNVIMPGRFWETAAHLFLYSLVLMWLPAALFFALSRLRMPDRLQHIVCAGVLLSAAVAVYFIV